VRKNPVTVGLYEDSIRKAASIIDVMVRDLRYNIERVSLLRELHEYKAKKANMKKRDRNRLLRSLLYLYTARWSGSAQFITMNLLNKA
jgi:hypothetical protein